MVGVVGDDVAVTRSGTALVAAVTVDVVIVANRHNARPNGNRAVDDADNDAVGGNAADDVDADLQ